MTWAIMTITGDPYFDGFFTLFAMIGSFAFVMHLISDISNAA